jgi:hypothetical protein
MDLDGASFVTLDPASLDLEKLFRDRDMFDTADDWSDAGFKILRASDNKITVASHKSVDGYLFKKYVSSGKRDSQEDQLENYECRIAGARKLRALIDKHNLQHVVVPDKWLRELPRDFNEHKRPSHMLIVERLNILDANESERKYARIDEAVLRDLCIVLHAFRGLDSTAKNVPFTQDGKIAFIDTEHWDRHSKRKSKQREFLKYIGDHLSSDRRKFAKKTLEELEDD